MLLQDTELKNVSGISNAERTAICAFLQDAVNDWCTKHNDEWFAARDLLGGDNFNWEETPMNALLVNNNVRQASIKAGWLLKHVIHDDTRTFDTRRGRLFRQYRWTGV